LEREEKGTGKKNSLVDAEPALTTRGCTLDHSEEIEAFLSEGIFTVMRRRLRGGGSLHLRVWGGVQRGFWDKCHLEIVPLIENG